MTTSIRPLVTCCGKESQYSPLRWSELIFVCWHSKYFKLSCFHTQWYLKFLIIFFGITVIKIGTLYMTVRVRFRRVAWWDCGPGIHNPPRHSIRYIVFHHILLLFVIIYPLCFNSDNPWAVLESVLHFNASSIYFLSGFYQKGSNISVSYSLPIFLYGREA